MPTPLPKLPGFKKLSGPTEGKRHEDGVRYAPITELGISYIDFRECRDGIKSGSSDPNKIYSVEPTLHSPGDRGINLCKRIRSEHFISDEYHDHNGLNCYADYHNASPQAFLFGKSSYVKEAELPAVLLQKLRNLSKHNRTKEERNNNILRKMFVITWDSQLEESFLRRSNLTGLYESDNVLNITPLDLQLHSIFTDHFGSGDRIGKNARAASLSLGIPTHVEGSEDQIHHNAGNDAAFQSQMFLAVAFLNETQYQAYTNGQEISDFLPPCFSGFTPFQVNKLRPFVPAPKRPRPDSPVDNETEPAAKSRHIEYAPDPKPAESHLRVSMNASDIEWIPKGWMVEEDHTISVPESLVRQSLEHFVKSGGYSSVSAVRDRVLPNPSQD
ncbi:unnamed protein product [Clonostachys solani]|uniref:Gfd2/YDR514C-like C-terminal domain-containing protein n=1 Tax=Clonostachys solani TaxID=160281 RepID=A0A9N9Z3L1_9HYPO|nr:unnamed protein product [Clonostachys solani]